MDKNRKRHIISEVQEGSIAWEMQVEPGDALLEINGLAVEDVFDYRFMIQEENLNVLIEKADGEQWELEIEKDADEDLGIEFEQPLLDEYRSCRNACIFCFIDQMPPGMRPTLYFKDDDSRLSFLQGNYVTMTNMSDHDLDRIIAYHMEPVNISFHTFNPRLRCSMLRNRFAGDVLRKAGKLHEAGIRMNGQIVLCKGINDGKELAYSCRELEKLVPSLESVSVVPVGLTRYREGLTRLESFTREDACEVIDLIEHWQDYYMEKWGMHILHASDEWYFLAGRQMPEPERYDGYRQLENGVGMVTLLRDEVSEYLTQKTGDRMARSFSLATGLLASPVMEELTDRVKEKYPLLQGRVYPIKNTFFGEKITVAGLLTGQDLLGALRGKPLGERLLISSNMLRSGEEVFLDDMSVAQLSEGLGVPVCVVGPRGEDLVEAMLGSLFH